MYSQWWHFYLRNDPIELFAYIDSDWIGDTVEKMGTLGYAFFIGSEVFSWSSKK